MEWERKKIAVLTTYRNGTQAVEIIADVYGQLALHPMLSTHEVGNMSTDLMNITYIASGKAIINGEIYVAMCACSSCERKWIERYNKKTDETTITILEEKKS